MLCNYTQCKSIFTVWVWYSVTAILNWHPNFTIAEENYCEIFSCSLRLKFRDKWYNFCSLIGCWHKWRIQSAFRCPTACHQSAILFSQCLTSPRLNFGHLTRPHSDYVASGWCLQKTWPPNAAAWRNWKGQWPPPHPCPLPPPSPGAAPPQAPPPGPRCDCIVLRSCRKCCNGSGPTRWGLNTSWTFPMTFCASLCEETDTQFSLDLHVCVNPAKTIGAETENTIIHVTFIDIWRKSPEQE